MGEGRALWPCRCVQPCLEELARGLAPGVGASPVWASAWRALWLGQGWQAAAEALGAPCLQASGFPGLVWGPRSVAQQALSWY